jgi:hypothetical protein
MINSYKNVKQILILQLECLLPSFLFFQSKSKSLLITLLQRSYETELKPRTSWRVSGHFHSQAQADSEHFEEFHSRQICNFCPNLHGMQGRRTLQPQTSASGNSVNLCKKLETHWIDDNTEIHTRQKLWPHFVVTGMKTRSWQQMHPNCSSTFERNACKQIDVPVECQQLMTSMWKPTW